MGITSQCKKQVRFKSYQLFSYKSQKSYFREFSSAKVLKIDIFWEVLEIFRGFVLWLRLCSLIRKPFDEMVRFVMKAMREGIPEDEIWATLEVMSSKELQADIAESLRNIDEEKVKRFRNTKEALDWLRL